MMGWMVETLFAATLLMALVMLLRRPVAHFFGARAAYLLWALPLLRMVLPPLPSGGAAAVLPASLAQGNPLVMMHVEDVIPAAQPGGFPWVEAAIGVWMAGACLFLVAQAVGYLRFRRLMLADGAVVDRQGGIVTIESAHATGPFAFGVLRRHVVLPVDFADRYDAAERAMALAHERAHHDRGDLAANLVALAMLGLHWCNPVAWIAYRAFRADQELACDATVLARHGGDQAQAYGRAIVKAASGRHFAAACHLKTVDNLKGRLKMLSSHTALLHRISLGMGLVALVIATGLALTASGSRAAEEMAGISQSVSGARMARLASFLPMPAVAPEAPATSATSEVPEVAQAPAAPRVPVVPDGSTVPEVPAVPSVPMAAHAGQVVPPVPPLPPSAPLAPLAPVPPVVPDLSGIPTRAEIAAMIPRIDVEQRCGRDRPVTTETRTANGRTRSVRILVCERDIAVRARHSALHGLERARAGLARADRAQDMSAAVRAQVIADLDREIARLRAQAEDD